MHDEKVDGDANGDGAAALRCAAACSGAAVLMCSLPQKSLHSF